MRVIMRRCWPVLERLTAAKLVSDLSTAAAARAAVDRRDLREAAEHEEIKVNWTAVTGRRPPLRGSVKNGLCTLHLLMPVLSETVATVSLSTAPTSRAVSN